VRFALRFAFAVCVRRVAWRCARYRCKRNCLESKFFGKSAAYIEWPVESPLHNANAFRWCVYGTFSFGTTLAELTRDLTFEGKRSEVKWIRKDTELSGCQIIFVSRSEAKNYAKVLDAARTGRALTVGETKDFLDAVEW